LDCGLILSGLVDKKSVLSEIDIVFDKIRKILLKLSEKTILMLFFFLPNLRKVVLI